MPSRNSTNGKSRGYAWGVGAIGLYQMVLAVALLWLVFVLWPERVAKDAPWTKYIEIGDWKRNLGDDARLILIVLCSGALGSCVHAATSFATYVGNRRLVLSWAWWYVLRPFIGAALALIFYFVIRGGLLSTGAAASDMSVFGVGAVAGLAGMFSKQATDKLRELFDNLFRTEQGQGDDARADKLGANLPVTSGMIERRKIAAFVVPDGQTNADVRVADLHRMLGGVVTRVPVLTHTDVPICVIHQSLVYKFLADHSIEAMKAKQPFDAERYTLADLLAAPGMKELVQDSLAYVPPGAMLSDVKEIMEHTPHCQDVFVTEHGQPGEPVVGWLTDAEVRRAAKV
jgi:hypothetical protein